jgi:hypothetical protein
MSNLVKRQSFIGCPEAIGTIAFSESLQQSFTPFPLPEHAHSA